MLPVYCLSQWHEFDLEKIFDFKNSFISLKVANSCRIPTELLSGYKFAVKLSAVGENRAANVPTGRKKFRICIFESWNISQWKHSYNSFIKWMRKCVARKAMQKWPVGKCSMAKSLLVKKNWGNFVSSSSKCCISRHIGKLWMLLQNWGILRKW